MHPVRLLSAGLGLLAAAWLASTEARAQAPTGAALFAGNFCPRDTKEIGRPFQDVRLCAYDRYFHYTGAIILMGTKFCPKGTLEAAGQTLPLHQNIRLYSLFGANFGGNGKSTFSMPDLRGKAPTANPALVYCMLVDAFYPQRE